MIMIMITIGIISDTILTIITSWHNDAFSGWMQRERRLHKHISLSSAQGGRLLSGTLAQMVGLINHDIRLFSQNHHKNKGGNIMLGAKSPLMLITFSIWNVEKLCWKYVETVRKYVAVLCKYVAGIMKNRVGAAKHSSLVAAGGKKKKFQKI